MTDSGDKAWQGALAIGAGAFFLALVVGWGSQAFLSRNASTILSFILLLLVILVGIIFDMIGMAAAVADQSAMNARAARKARGAKQALRIARNPGRVASFCNDVMGDVAATVSGAIGASIVVRLFSGMPDRSEILLNIAMTASVSAITVGGKAFGKLMAIRESSVIVLQVGILLSWLEDVLGIRLLGDNDRSKNKKRKGRAK